jgi:hypothetical protein
VKNKGPFSPAVLASGLIIAVLGGVIVALIVGEGRFAPATLTIPTLAPPTAIVVTPAPLKVETEVTMGGVRKTYNQHLNDGELLVGHADKFQGYSPCVAFLIVGPGTFEFWIESGLWDKWINTTPQSYQPLLQEQIDTLVNKYQCTPVKTVRLP